MVAAEALSAAAGTSASISAVKKAGFITRLPKIDGSTDNEQFLFHSQMTDTNISPTLVRICETAF